MRVAQGKKKNRCKVCKKKVPLTAIKCRCFSRRCPPLPLSTTAAARRCHCPPPAAAAAIVAAAGLSACLADTRTETVSVGTVALAALAPLPPTRCRCKNLYCNIHRYPGEHSCTYNYQNMQQEILTERNPVCAASQIDQI